MKLDLLADRGLREDQGPALGPHGLCNESGQDLIEYGLLSAVLSIAFIGMIKSIGNGVIPFFEKVIAVLLSV